MQRRQRQQRQQQQQLAQLVAGVWVQTTVKFAMRMACWQ
jgi:hypothetical protein